jgi:hypothetical protein
MMNYKLNLALMLVVFSAVTYNVCKAYEGMDQIAVEDKFQEIGLLENTKVAFIIPPRKPAQTSQVASIK